MELVGNKYNHLTITGIDVDRSHNNKYKHIFCFASCDCNENIKSYDLSAIKTGHTKSCGCSKFNNPLIAEDLTNQNFGRLTVICRDIERDRNREGKSGNAHWLCKCSCGNEELVSVNAYHLKKGITKSCGCLVSETTAERNRIYSPKKNKTYLYKNNDINELDNIIEIWDEQHVNSFIIDKEDYDFISQWYWRKDVSRRRSQTEGYWISNARKQDIANGYPTTLRLHQMIAERKYGKYDKSQFMPDHANRNHNDNTRKNLILKQNLENTHNRNKSISNTSGKTGVCPTPNHKKWTAYITVNYKHIYLGSYISYDDAVNARLEAEKKYGFTCDDVVADYDITEHINDTIK